jgi:hypothetical protein
MIRAGESPRFRETPRKGKTFGWYSMFQDWAASYKVWITAMLKTI